MFTNSADDIAAYVDPLKNLSTKRKTTSDLNTRLQNGSEPIMK
jgi:hypothetical protein